MRKYGKLGRGAYHFMAPTPASKKDKCPPGNATRRVTPGKFQNVSVKAMGTTGSSIPATTTTGNGRIVRNRCVRSGRSIMPS